MTPICSCAFKHFSKPEATPGSALLYDVIVAVVHILATWLSIDLKISTTIGVSKAEDATILSMFM